MSAHNASSAREAPNCDWIASLLLRCGDHACPGVSVESLWLMCFPFSRALLGAPSHTALLNLLGVRASQHTGGLVDGLTQVLLSGFLLDKGEL